MFCANCGKKIDDDTRFCPHCGAEADAPDAPEEATPEPSAPAPVASAPEPTPTTEPAAAAPPVAPPPVATATTPAAAVPPPASTPPAAPAVTDGQPPKKGSSKCWFIGCGILLLLAILGGVGTCVYGIKKGGEAAQNIQEQLEDQGFEFESPGNTDDDDDADGSRDDDDSSSSSSDDDDNAGVPDMSDVDWDQISDSMPEGAAGALEGLMGQIVEMADSDEMRETMQTLESALPKATVQMFFLAWHMGNVDEARELMTDDCSDKISDSALDGGYTQMSLDVTGDEKLDGGGWMFRVEETSRIGTDGDEKTKLFLVEVVSSDNAWLVDEVTELDSDE